MQRRIDDARHFSSQRLMDRGDAMASVEVVKRQGLAGDIAGTLARAERRFGKDDGQRLKHFGIYQQQDGNMVRLKIPGGRFSTAQYLAVTDIALHYANSQFMITTRQDVQLHTIRPQHLSEIIGILDRLWLTTQGACGDVVRNVTTCPVSDLDRDCPYDTYPVAKMISDALLLNAPAYFEIFVPEKLLPADLPAVNPIYGEALLPRKFKIGVGLSTDNCAFPHTDDIGLVAVVNPAAPEGIDGYNVLVGGGLGSTPLKPDTHPALGQVLGMVAEEHVLSVVQAIVGVQRDHGNRENRKLARLKYLVARWGIERVRDAVHERLAGQGLDIKLKLPHPVPHYRVSTHLGLHPQRASGLFYWGLPIFNGEISEEGQVTGKHAKALGGSNLIFFRDLVRDYRLGVRFTVNQDLILTDIAAAGIPDIRRRLQDYGIPTEADVSPLRAQSHACVGVYHTASLDFPGEIVRYCPLSFTEAKLFLPQLLQGLEDDGYGDLAIPINITGCPNSCAFSAIGGIGLWGALKRQPDGHEYFDMRIGGTMEGAVPRLAVPIHQRLRDDRVAPTIKGLFDFYRRERLSDESFSDFCYRTGTDELRQRVPAS
jgi:sulfite reductase (ferredoxin)